MANRSDDGCISLIVIAILFFVCLSSCDTGNKQGMAIKELKEEVYKLRKQLHKGED